MIKILIVDDEKPICDLIDLNLKEGSGWVIDKNASTKERTILYYTGILPHQPWIRSLLCQIRTDL